MCNMGLKLSILVSHRRVNGRMQWSIDYSGLFVK